MSWPGRTGLGVDGGQGATRWALAGPDGQVLARGTLAPLTGHLFSAAARTRAAALMRGLTDSLPTGVQPCAALLGLSGLASGTPAAEFIGQTAADLLGIPAGQIQVADDLRIAHLAAFADLPGVLVYAGTGAAAYTLDAQARAVRAGGHGYLIDDAGGGFWIGREALRLLLRARDEGTPGPTGDLARRLDAALGGPAWASIREAVYAGRGRERLAALAPEVAAAAAAGDALATGVIDRAGLELARLADLVIRRAGLRPPVQVAFTGGAARDLLARSLFNNLPPGCRPAPPAAYTPAEAAARLAAANASTGKGAQPM